MLIPERVTVCMSVEIATVGLEEILLPVQVMVGVVVIMKSEGITITSLELAGIGFWFLIVKVRGVAVLIFVLESALMEIKEEESEAGVVAV